MSAMASCGRPSIRIGDWSGDGKNRHLGNASARRVADVFPIRRRVADTYEQPRTGSDVTRTSTIWF
jgi:hypothetical protein